MHNNDGPTPSETSQPAKPRLGAGLFARLRKWHGWLGVAMSLLIVVVCLSGLYLNHKDLFDGLLPSRRAEAPLLQFASLSGGVLLADAKLSSSGSPRFIGRLTTTTPPVALQSCLEQALREAKGKWGDVPLEKIELNLDHGSLLCKVTSSGKDQLTVDAASVAVSTKEDRKKPEKAQGGGKQDKAMEPGRLIKELHTGKLAGLTGKLLVDFTSLTILALTLSGLYLWAWPKLRRQQAPLSA